MRSLQQSYAVEHDGCVTSNAALEPRVRALIERLSRINYVIDMHRQAIAMQSKRRAEVQAELEQMDAPPMPVPRRLRIVAVVAWAVRR